MTATSVWPEAQVAFSHSRICATVMTGSDMPDKIADSLYFKSGNLVIRSSIPSKPKSTVDFIFWPASVGFWFARGVNLAHARVERVNLPVRKHFIAAAFQK
jgi:hypothetical protein